jgi:hypothetical protein
MEHEALWLDGNALAGVLAAALGAELSAAPRTCQSCGTLSAVGAHRAYRSAGVVLRCPGCGDVALRLAELPDRYVVVLAGTWTLVVPAV